MPLVMEQGALFEMLYIGISPFQLECHTRITFLRKTDLPSPKGILCSAS